MSGGARAVFPVLSVALMCATFAHDGHATAAKFEITALTPDSELTSALTIIDQQAGFVGIEGVRWSIDPDGAFRAVRFVNERTEPAHQQGRLTRDELKSLGARLESDLPHLPTQSGEAAPVNAHTIVIQFGCRIWTLQLPTGRTIFEAQQEHARSPDSPEALFLRVVSTTLGFVDHERQ